MTELKNKEWIDHPKNPLIEPSKFELIIADPTVLPPDKSKNGLWNLFAHSIFGIYHYKSRDGLTWSRGRLIKIFGIRPFIYSENEHYYLFYEKLKFIVPMTKILHSNLEVIVSQDLENWSKPKIVLQTKFAWQGRNIGNPCLVKFGKNKYRLYFASGIKWMEDCYFPEPNLMGYADSKNILGPYETVEQPIGDIILRPVNRNYGFGLNWYKDELGRNRSRILEMKSSDGIEWKTKRILLNLEGNSWRRTFVYMMGFATYKKEKRMYYNARDGWLFGRERIGLSIFNTRKK